MTNLKLNDATLGAMHDPYATVGNVTLFHADCRDILPQLHADTVITDPVWPGADVPLEGRDNCAGLLEETLRNCLAAERLALHVGCRTDPRLFETVPERFGFFRVAWLRYSVPSYQGRVLNGADVAYLYGDPPSPPEYGHLVPGEFIENGAKGKERDHPTPRKLSHVEWLVKWWSAPDDRVVDPFAGSGTTGLAAMRWDRECILVECVEKHCETAARVLEQEAKQPTLNYG